MNSKFNINLLVLLMVSLSFALVQFGAANNDLSAEDRSLTFIAEQAAGKGKFEKITKKQTLVTIESEVPEQKEDTTSDLAKTLPETDETTDNFVPLPPVEEDETVETVDSADEQPDLEEPLTDDRWPGWLLNYRKGCEEAKQQEKMLLVYFYDTNDDSPYTAFETESLADDEVKELLNDYICVRIPLTATLSPTNVKVDVESDDADETETQADDNAQRHTAMRPSMEKLNASKLIAPGRNMGSVAQLQAKKFDLTFPKLDEETMLMKHPAFYEMLNTPGVAIIDYKNKDTDYFGSVVSVFPFLKKKPYTIEQTKVMLTLPPGTVTQRSVVFAVRIHPDNPKSTTGDLNLQLVEEARSHSQHQADIRKQGHHNWDRRFQRINRELPIELWAVEVCAESWPGQHLLESAIECVACWRFSEGHWSAVVAEHPYYGYDMKLGTNGIWYATGVFGKWRHPMLAKAGKLSKSEQRITPKP